MKVDTIEFDEERSSDLSFILFQTILALAVLVQTSACLCTCDFDVVYAQKVGIIFPLIRTFHNP